MEPIWGFVLYLGTLIVICIVASKRGRPFWPYLLFAPIASFVLIPVSARSGASGMGSGLAAFAPLLVAFIASLASRSGTQIAAEQGSYRGMRKCPHCAETIKAEATKCKHCGSHVAITPI